MLLIGTKLDLVMHSPHIREVETDAGEEVMRSRSNIIEYAEVSAKEGINLDLSFLKLAEELKRREDIQRGCSCEHKLSTVYPRRLDTVQVDKQSQKSGCCTS